MSYIYCSYDNYYKPSESLQTLFEELVVQPFENHPSTQEWEYHVTNQTQQYHREEILKRGRANFSESHNGLSPEDMVSLYCVYYLPMHLFSSYHIFTKHLAPVNNKVVFVDFGCGPLTSGIAFWAALSGHRDITYFGIDSSERMLDKAREINRYGPYGDGSPFIKGWPTPDYNQLHQYLDDCIEAGNETHIIFNFSYFLASETLDIRDLSDWLTQIVEKYNQHKMFVIYQNPLIPQGYSLQTSRLHKNWYFLNTQLSMFQSQITQSNIEQFSYDSLVDGEPLTFKFYFDILSNKASAPFNDPFESPPIF